MRNLLRYLVWAALIAAALIAAARVTAIRWWKVPAEDLWLGASVSPSMAPGEWVLLWRLTKPHLGELVVCPEPGAPERIVVGRVLGLARDKVIVESGHVTLNGKMLRRESSCDKFQVVHPKSGQSHEQRCSIEDLDGDLYRRGDLIEGVQAPPATAPVVVEDDKFFLVSDNRQFPLDSRDFGQVEASSCRETVIFRLWGPNGYFDPNRRFELVR